MPEPTETSNEGTFLQSVIRRPIEFALIGAILLAIMYGASQADLMPKVLKGAGIEVEFQERVVQAVVGTEGGIKDLNQQVSELRAEVAQLRRELAENQGTPITAGPSEAPVTTFSSDTLRPAFKEDIAAVQSLLVQKTATNTGVGYVWVGTYDFETQSWTDSSLESAVQEELPPPSALANEKVRLLTDLNIRADFPAQTESYFSNITALGVATKGQTATILSRPLVYDRDNGSQVWAEMQITYQPYLGFE